MKKQTIFNADELITALSQIAKGGQFATLKAETEVKLNKKATDGTKELRDTTLYTKEYVVRFNLSENYERAMTKVLGVDYKADDPRWHHDIPSLIKTLKNTGAKYLIYIPKEYISKRFFANGIEATAEQLAYMKRFLPNHKKDNRVVDYHIVKFDNIREINCGGNSYKVCMSADLELKRA